jgi:alkyl sulfatase BDS1-like metallo-beta-lactamase superfamily hydrolase
VVDEGAPLIAGQPKGQQVVEGQGAVLEVGVVSCPPLGYQWYFNGTNAVLEATNATLVLGQVREEQAGAYTVVVTNGYGAATSQVAQVSVVVPAQILSGPLEQTVTNGQRAELTVGVRGTEPLFYQWYFNGTNVLVEATNALLVLEPVSPVQAGSYLVVVTNAYGSVTSAPVRLSVAVPVLIVSSPGDLTVTNGDRVELSVVAGGSEPLAYQWYFNGTNAVWEATNATLVLEQVRVDQGGV